MTTLATVKLWGTEIGVVSIEADARAAVFAYTPEFARSGIEVAPLTLPLREEPYQFLALPAATFKGLPGLLADSLPDRFGNALIDAWLESRGRPRGGMDVVERLCYTGTRGMGALEFFPQKGPRVTQSHPLEVGSLVQLASDILTQRGDMEALMNSAGATEILRVGTSAGGARAKAVIAWNETTNEVRSGQVDVPPGFSHWLLKFDGVRGNKDKETLEDPQGYGAIEFACHLMARDAGIEMAACRLFEEGGRRHFMTRRFDRTAAGKKIHMLSLGAIAHMDYNSPGVHSYEQAAHVAQRLKLPQQQIEQLFRRMAFNIVCRNQDDHVKNIAFLMDRRGHWSLSPAFDLVYSYNPAGAYTAQHQMSMNGRRDGFAVEDFRACGEVFHLKRGRAETILQEVVTVVKRWAGYAAQARVDEGHIVRVQNGLRLDF